MAIPEIQKTTLNDWNEILNLFKQAQKLQDQNQYRVWVKIDEKSLQEEIQNGHQYKIVERNTICFLFSVLKKDPLIWKTKEQNDALYLHRMVTHPDYKGMRYFNHALNWLITFAKKHDRQFLRMDTWADNEQLIRYYQTYGFQRLGYSRTGNDTALPRQNRNLRIVLLELKLH